MKRRIGPHRVGAKSSGSELARTRVAMGLTQGELGARIGISDAMISLYETGYCRPRMPRAEHIAAALGRTVAALWPTLDRAVKKGRLLDTVIPMESVRKRGVARTHGMRLAYADPDGGTRVHHEHRPPICCGDCWCRVVDLRDPETYRVVGEPTRIAAGGANA